VDALFHIYLVSVEKLKKVSQATTAPEKSGVIFLPEIPAIFHRGGVWLRFKYAGRVFCRFHF